LQQAVALVEETEVVFPLLMLKQVQRPALPLLLALLLIVVGLKEAGS